MHTLVKRCVDKASVFRFVCVVHVWRNYANMSSIVRHGVKESRVYDHAYFIFSPNVKTTELTALNMFLCASSKNN